MTPTKGTPPIGQGPTSGQLALILQSNPTFRDVLGLQKNDTFYGKNIATCPLIAFHPTHLTKI